MFVDLIDVDVDFEQVEELTPEGYDELVAAM